MRARCVPQSAMLAHVSTRGGIHNAVDNARVDRRRRLADPSHVRAAVAPAAPRRRRAPRVPSTGTRPPGCAATTCTRKYLINLATPKEHLLRQSIGSLVHHMQLAEQLGADGVVFHPGSHLGAGFDGTLDQVAGAIAEVLDTVPNSPAMLLVENSAGLGRLRRLQLRGAGTHRRGGRLGPRGRVPRHAAHVRQRLRRAQPRPGARPRWTGSSADVGFDRLALVHANDSRTPLGSNADRHANIGEGEMGLEAFSLLARGRPAQRRAVDHRGPG